MAMAQQTDYLVFGYDLNHCPDPRKILKDVLSLRDRTTFITRVYTSIINSLIASLKNIWDTLSVASTIYLSLN